ncbi:hypothetical protein [Paenibacillus tepidiphilus]|uniref:hypothetical protein n=1 Tax=Paenibacillus tepidiphilus TaxID=2608683 RepID=UPI0012384AA0|nr:hypothetical protein [Paenibacillus tepidiphilus]
MWIMVDFSPTFALSTFTAAHCGQFFDYNGSVFRNGKTLWSIFRLRLPYLPSQKPIMVGFSTTVGLISRMVLFVGLFTGE